MRRFATFAGLLTLIAAPVFAGPVSFPECPAVGNDTNGCELLITITGVQNGVATSFTVTTASPDQGPINGTDATLIGVLNGTSLSVSRLFFAVGSGVGTLNFNHHGACMANSGVPIYSPAPTPAQCLNGQYWSTDAMDYASTSVTFLSFDLAHVGVILGEPAGILAPGGSSWFTLPGALTAADIRPTPEPVSLLFIGAGLGALLVGRRRASTASR